MQNHTRQPGIAPLLQTRQKCNDCTNNNRVWEKLFLADMFTAHGHSASLDSKVNPGMSWNATIKININYEHSAYSM